MTATLLLLFCVASGGHCRHEPAARVTEYVPEWGGINCAEPCNLTASMTPVTPGVTAACGPSIPFGTRVYIEGVSWRTCQDRGGAIDNDEVDVAVKPIDYMMHGINGTHAVTWVLPRQ